MERLLGVKMDNNSNQKIDKLLEIVQRLEERISNIEDSYGISQPEEMDELKENIVTQRREESLEQAIGKGWFAKLGIVVLLVGLMLFLRTSIGDSAPIVPSLIGLILAAIIFIGSWKFKTSYSQISGYLLGGSLILIYFSVVRLHFFAEVKVIDSRTLIVFLLLLVTIFHFIVAIKKESLNFAIWSVILGCLTALISDNYIFIFSLLTAIGLTVVYLKINLGWINLLYFGIFFTYLTHFLWFINNPFLGHEISALNLPWHLPVILVYSIIFSIGNLISKDEPKENYVAASISFMNAIFGYGLMLVASLISPFELVGYFHLFAAIVFILISIFYWQRQKSIFSTFINAMTGYAALSFAIINLFTGTDLFVVLCWQSLLVVSTAIWFRSKYIIVTNFIIFILIFFAYLLMVDIVTFTSISFGLVALITARILNWKKASLNLQSEQMRNGYLITALIVIPYSFYHSLSANYVAYSWAAVAMVYYWLSSLLHNIKYRWMSVATMLMTTIYVIIFGISSDSTVDRIFSFIFVGILLLAMSLLYTKKSKQK